MIVKPFSHFSAGSVIEEGAGHIRYRLDLAEGEGIATIRPVLPGVEVVELAFSAPRYVPTLHPGRDLMEINHCLAGRAECRMGDGCLQYIGEGDLFLSTLHNHSESIELPLGHYRGMAVMIEPVQAARQVESALCEVSFSMERVLERFFAQDDCFLIPAKADIAHIFAGMYTAPAEVRGIYYRLKVQELLLYLHYFDPAREPQKPVYARQQVEIIKQVHKQLTMEPGRRFTIEELAQRHCISATALKTGFKAVYGTSVAAYMKEYRIRQAAELLRNTSKSVAEIGAEMGYESQSKFGAAFKERMGLTPLEYRKKCGTGG